MGDENCIFCKVVQGDLPCKKIKENDQVLVVEDIAPKAPVHYLIIPKKHITNISYLTTQDKEVSFAMLLIAREIANEIGKQQNLNEPLSFNLLSNNGAKAGQSVFHMHWHFIAGKNLYLNGLQL